MDRRLLAYFTALFLPLAALLLVLGGVLSAFLARAWCRREAMALANVQREARESSASLRLILQSNPNAMLIVDRHGFITDANPSAEATFGLGAVEMRALRVDELVPSAVSGSHARLRDSYFAAPHARPMGAGVDLTARRKDGTEFPVEISLAPLTLRGEAFVVATVVDITARKQAERKVRTMNASLERRVEERTLELGSRRGRPAPAARVERKRVVRGRLRWPGHVHESRRLRHPRCRRRADRRHSLERVPRGRRAPGRVRQLRRAHAARWPALHSGRCQLPACRRRHGARDVLDASDGARRGDRRSGGQLHRHDRAPPPGRSTRECAARSRATGQGPQRVPLQHEP